MGDADHPIAKGLDPVPLAAWAGRQPAVDR